VLLEGALSLNRIVNIPNQPREKTFLPLLLAVSAPENHRDKSSNDKY